MLKFSIIIHLRYEENFVETLKNRLRINVGFIVNSTVGYHRDFPFEFPSYLDEDLELVDVSGNINVGRTPQGLIVAATFSGKSKFECGRCLTVFDKEIVWDFTELFSFKEENMSDSGLLVPEDAQIDFKTLFREYAILEFPIRPICSEDCKGLCLECGQNLNLKDCGHIQVKTNAFSKLKDLLN
jgi:uncharacterized protein